ncbi:GspE/PulE family protein [Paraglaciecola arctica]|uniref:General secretion pathway protein E n=1 Tax=Paraglaciecola arctica BSs20135 TaxID=493475 RepID=K6YPL7_9ALTE|nr:GspE/PulE family protein [Paraglaciecola arctica]GAC18583.1 general secretion pathway protein E [Paraglaciecola arctica BSs20135]
MKPKAKIRLGDLLVQQHIINEEQLMQALAAQKESGRKLGFMLIELGLVTENQLLTFLSQHLNVPLVDISQYDVSLAAVNMLPEVQARRHRALVLEDKGDRLLVAMSDPADLAGIDVLSRLLPKPIDVAVVSDAQLVQAYDNLYRRTDEIASFAQELAEEYQDVAEFDFNAGVGDDQDTAVARLLQSIFEDAVQAKASDIHIEPDESMLRIRMRVDGVLQENVIKEKNIASALVLRLKLMSGLDISEKRLPQDGRTSMRIKGHSIDVRVSTMPIQAGESVVMRLLDQSAGLLTLEQTGMPNNLLTRFRSLLHRPHGMILVTGPTGSGKTTTLYGALSELNTAASKIITVEDPVEYRLPRINQVQTNNKIGLTFSNILRTTLRQDPDIIMVGEMRDQETAEIGLRGALTGHLVLSTLHTNDAISSAVRLLDMGAPGYLVASSLRAMVAQRLVRKICKNCSEDYRLNTEELLWLNNLDDNLKAINFKRGRGCQSCNKTGYKGRIGVFELLEMTESMMNALKLNDTITFSQAAHKSPGFVPLAKVALMYAKMGITTVDEVLKLIEMVADERAITQPVSTETIEQELAQVVEEHNTNETSSDETPKASGFSLELEPQNPLPGGDGGTV